MGRVVPRAQVFEATEASKHSGGAGKVHAPPPSQGGASFAGPQVLALALALALAPALAPALALALALAPALALTLALALARALILTRTLTLTLTQLQRGRSWVRRSAASRRRTPAPTR